MIQENWTVYTSWLKSELPNYAALLNPGASEKEIEKLETYLGFSLPEDFKKVYRLNNGDSLENHDDIYLGAFLGFEFLSIDRIISIHSEQIQYDNSGYDGSSYPENHIKVLYFNSKWIPLFADSVGNFVGLDFDPDTKGSKGQLINFGRDEERKFIIADSLNSFLEFVKTKIQSGDCDAAIAEEDDGGLSYGLCAQSHLIDDLREIFGN